MLSDPYVWSRRSSARGVSCLLAGDMNIQGREDPPSVFRHLNGTLTDADVLFGNLEGCLYRPGERDLPGKRRWKHSSASMVTALVAAGFDAVGCANNVTYGSEATLRSLGVLEISGIAHCGAGPNRDAARAPAIVAKRGRRFGFLQYTARLQTADQAASSERPGVAAFDPELKEDLDEICSDVRRLRPQVDILVVSHHLRLAGTSATEPYQRKLARSCIDAGADVVYAHGAHVNQGIELWKGAPIFHCVGQLAFDWSAMRQWKEGLLVRLLLEDGRLVSVSALLVHRDDNNDAYLLDPRSPAGEIQLSQLRRLSPGMTLPIEAGEVVIISR